MGESGAATGPPRWPEEHGSGGVGGGGGGLTVCGVLNDS
jgi:hypothetical protein